SGMSAEASAQYWRELAGLRGEPAVSVFPHRAGSGSTVATRYVWGTDPAGMQVEFLKIDRGGHVQPSIAHRLSWTIGMLVGDQNADLEFAEETWAFFKTKERR
ncbi:MAG TPA: hypothetical protein VIT92_13130, partial [Burkholderiaceae bacterium]